MSCNLVLLLSHSSRAPYSIQAQSYCLWVSDIQAPESTRNSTSHNKPWPTNMATRTTISSPTLRWHVHCPLSSNHAELPNYTHTLHRQMLGTWPFHIFSLCLCGFPSGSLVSSQIHASRWTGDLKLLLGVNEGGASEIYCMTLLQTDILL